MTAAEPAPDASVPHQRRRRALHPEPSARTSVHRSRQVGHGDPPGAGGGGDRREMLYNGRPARFTFKNFQVVGSNEQLAEVGVKDLGASDEEGGHGDPRFAAHPAQPAEGTRRRRAQGLRQEVPRHAGATRQSGRPARRDGLAGHRGGGELRHAAGHRGGVRRRLRRPLREPHRAEPLPRHRVGLQLREPALHPAVHLLRRSRRGAGCSSTTS